MADLYMNFPANPVDGQEYASPLGVSYFYSEQYNVWTTFIIPATGYITNVIHFFNNDTNSTLSLSSSNSKVTVTALNESAVDASPSPSCPYSPLLKKYGVSFATPFANTLYTVNVFDVSNIAAGGASGAYNSYEISDKTTSGFTLQFCIKSNTTPGSFTLGYRRSFSIDAQAA